MPSSPEVLAIGSVLAHRYELVKEIGRGGCAIVYEARDLRLSRVVALKLPVRFADDTVKVSRFARESRVIASIHHPNVCAALDNGTTPDGTPFLVMERLFGESLRTTINRFGQLDVLEALNIGIQLLSALVAVHGAGIVHRDIKPDNVILVSRGGCDPLVKLLDFGLCRQASRRRNDEETMTCEGSLVGTPEYMAPEQVIGSLALDIRVDVYAVGVLLYEALSGERIFFSRKLQDILSGVMMKQIRPLRQTRRDVSRTLEQIIARAMDRNPERRHSSALEFQSDLNALRAEVLAAQDREAQTRVRSEMPTTSYRYRMRPYRPIRPARSPASAR